VIGRAELAFEKQRGRTVLVRSRVNAPMAVVRPFDLPGGGLLVQLLSLGPGLCGGDRIHIDVAAGAGTRVAITTTAATRVMSMDDSAAAEQHVTLRAGEASVLEYYPSLTIPFPNAALAQTISAAAAADARIGVVECWAMGRAARAEYLQFRVLDSRTTIAIDGRTVYVDAMRLDSRDRALPGAGVLAGRRYIAAGVWCGVTLPVADSEEAPLASRDPLVAFGPSREGLAYLRALGADGPAVDAAVRASVERVARAWGLPPVALERFHN